MPALTNIIHIHSYTVSAGDCKSSTTVFIFPPDEEEQDLLIWSVQNVSKDTNTEI